MVWRSFRLVLMVAFIAVNCRAYCTEVSQNTVEYKSDVAPQDAHYDVPDTNIPFISINTDMRRDLNWAAALEFTDPDLRPVPVVLPLLEDYPFDNLEIKLRVLNVKF